MSIKSVPSLLLAAGLALSLLSGCGMTAEERAKMDESLAASRADSAKARADAEQCRAASADAAKSAEKSKRAFEHGLKKK